MSDKIFIVGHKSPDLDSVAAAIFYAEYKNKIAGEDKYAPAAAGELNRETIYVLEKFGFNAPEILDSVEEKTVILVDHNATSQSVSGIEKAKVVEVLDHHKVDFRGTEPIEFLTKPVGATCSIIAQKYFDSKMEISKNSAGLALSAILVDTVITKSPTCSSVDKEIIEKLSEIAGVADWKEFGMELFKIKSSIKNLGEAEIIKSDFKDFDFKAGKFGIGSVETVALEEFTPREDNLLAEMKKIKENEAYHTIILFMIDIINEGSQFLILSDDEEKVGQALGGEFKNNRAYFQGVLSRKKQVVPKLTEAFDK
ncbi:MAG: manganese-dependent inorganic pyrophosphatase [bacterium]